MSNLILFLLLLTLTASFVFLVFFAIARKLAMYSQKKRKAAIKGIFRKMLVDFMSMPFDDFDLNLEKLARKINGKSKFFKKVADEYLLELLEQSGKTNRTLLRTIARRLNFLSECTAQIKSGIPIITALGSRRAGLYNFTEAASDMVEALDYLSNESQFEILLGLARMGNAQAMLHAFKKIHKAVVINERAVIEILNTFPMGKGKIALFNKMINRNIAKNAGYITTLFLKASDKEMVKALTANIIDVMNEGSKDIRAAAVRSLATLESEAPVDELIGALEDRNWEVRAIAAKAMGSVESKEASLALFNALFDKEWWVRQNAVNSMIKHSTYHSLFILAIETGDRYTRDSIISTLENSGEHILSRSIKLMSADDSFSLPKSSPHAVSLETV